MTDQEKTKQQLISELSELRQRVWQWEKSEEALRASEEQLPQLLRARAHRHGRELGRQSMGS